jgi:hypothetical protein
LIRNERSQRNFTDLLFAMQRGNRIRMGSIRPIVERPTLPSVLAEGKRLEGNWMEAGPNPSNKMDARS